MKHPKSELKKNVIMILLEHRIGSYVWYLHITLLAGICFFKKLRFYHNCLSKDINHV